MKVSAIKKLVNENNLDVLRNAEKKILNEEDPGIDAGGDNPGEELTHILAAIFIKEKMEAGVEFKKALREYSGKVRNSMS